MYIEVYDEGHYRRCALHGELDLATFPEVEERLLEAEADGPHILVVDLRGVTFMDSQGLRLLLLVHRRASEDDRRVVVVRGPRNVQRVVDLSGLEHEWEFVSDLSEITL